MVGDQATKFVFEPGPAVLYDAYASELTGLRTEDFVVGLVSRVA